MSPSPILPSAAQRSRSPRLLGGGVAGALATLVLLSGCGAASTASSDDEEAAATPPAAAAEAEPAKEAEEAEAEQASTATEDSEPATSTSAAPEETTSETAAEETTPDPQPEPAEPQSFSGTGSEVVILEPLGEDVFFATVTHQGSGNVALWSVDENGQDLDLMVNEIGNYEGQVAVNFDEDPAAIRVEADGEWVIDLVHITEAPRWDGDSAYEATGDSIVIVDGVADGLTPVTLTHVGESNFAIWAWGESYPDLIVNDIGTYDGTTLLPDGSVALQVNADGNWSIAKN